jgi:hypothetical protein
VRNPQIGRGAIAWHLFDTLPSAPRVCQGLIRLLKLQVQISSLEQEIDDVLVQLDTSIQYLNGRFRSPIRNHRQYPCHGHNL